MKNEVAEFISRCIECQQVKVEHWHPTGILQPLPIPNWKGEVISFDFVTDLPKNQKQNDSIMVVVDKLSKATHFIRVKKLIRLLTLLTSLWKKSYVCMEFQR